jgi:hypothetical protein
VGGGGYQVNSQASNILREPILRSSLWTFALGILFLMLACESPPTAPRENVSEVTTSFDLRYNPSFPDWPPHEGARPGNVPVTGTVIAATMRVQGYPHCPEQQSVHVVTPSGRRTPAWDYESGHPCPYPGAVPNDLIQSLLTMMTYRDNIPFPAAVGENYYSGPWRIEGAHRVQQNAFGHFIEILVTVRLTARITERGPAG